jgi:hypothetical protein
MLLWLITITCTTPGESSSLSMLKDFLNIFLKPGWLTSSPVLKFQWHIERRSKLAVGSPIFLNLKTILHS